MNSCYQCAHLKREMESWEMPEIWWWECAKKPAMANLKNFPFKNTQCKVFEQLDLLKNLVFVPVKK